MSISTRTVAERSTHTQEGATRLGHVGRLFRWLTGEGRLANGEGRDKAWNGVTKHKEAERSQLISRRADIMGGKPGSKTRERCRRICALRGNGDNWYQAAGKRTNFVFNAKLASGNGFGSAVVMCAWTSNEVW